MVIALALYILARLLPPAQGLTASGQAVLGTVICGMVLWMLERCRIFSDRCIIGQTLGY